MKLSIEEKEMLLKLSDIIQKASWIQFAILTFDTKDYVNMKIDDFNELIRKTHLKL